MHAVTARPPGSAASSSRRRSRVRSGERGARRSARRGSVDAVGESRRRRGVEPLRVVDRRRRRSLLGEHPECVQKRDAQRAGLERRRPRRPRGRAHARAPSLASGKRRERLVQHAVEKVADTGEATASSRSRRVGPAAHGARRLLPARPRPARGSSSPFLPLPRARAAAASSETLATKSRRDASSASRPAMTSTMSVDRTPARRA